MHVYPSVFLENRRFQINPKLCFVLMPFSEPWSNRIYKTLKNIIEPLGYECRRADETYGHIVLSDIWRLLNEAAFVVADLTGQNPNVYYELGIVHCIGRDVIPILQRDRPIPFDQRAFRILLYEDNADGYDVLTSEVPKWISNLDFDRNPVVIIKNEWIAQLDAWRTRNSTCRLIGEDFSRLDLPGINLSEFALSECSFAGSNLDGAKFAESILVRANFTRSSLRAADFRGANISEAILQSADLSHAALKDCIMLRPHLDGAAFHRADVDGLTIDRKSYDRYRTLFDTALNPAAITIE
jgi:hypothetical protein